MSELTFQLQASVGVVTARGKVKVGQVEAMIRQAYPSLETRYVLWNLLEADLSLLGLDELRLISRVARQSLPPRLGVRIAYVTDSHVFTTMMCIYSAIATLAENPAEYSVFSTIEEARTWLVKAEEDPAFPVFLRTRESLNRASRLLSERGDVE